MDNKTASIELPFYKLLVTNFQPNGGFFISEYILIVHQGDEQRVLAVIV